MIVRTRMAFCGGSVIGDCIPPSGCGKLRSRLKRHNSRQQREHGFTMSATIVRSGSPAASTQHEGPTLRSTPESRCRPPESAREDEVAGNVDALGELSSTARWFIAPRIDLIRQRADAEGRHAGRFVRLLQALAGFTGTTSQFPAAQARCRAAHHVLRCRNEVNVEALASSRAPTVPLSGSRSPLRPSACRPSTARFSPQGSGRLRLHRNRGTPGISASASDGAKVSRTSPPQPAPVPYRRRTFSAHVTFDFPTHCLPGRTLLTRTWPSWYATCVAVRRGQFVVAAIHGLGRRRSAPDEQVPADLVEAHREGRALAPCRRPTSQAPSSRRPSGVRATSPRTVIHAGRRPRCRRGSRGGHRRAARPGGQTLEASATNRLAFSSPVPGGTRCGTRRRRGSGTRLA